MMHQSEGMNSLVPLDRLNINLSTLPRNPTFDVSSHQSVLFCFFQSPFSDGTKVESAAVVRSLAKRQTIPPPSFGCRLNKLDFTLDAHKENSCDCNSFCATCSCDSG